MAVSLRPSTFTQGGLIDDVDAVIKRARFVSYDYDGKADKPALCLLLQLVDNEDTEHAQYYSAGDLQYFVPSEDPKNEDLNGIEIVAVGDKTALNGGTNCALMLNSLVTAGLPEDLLDSGDMRKIEGLKAHWNRVAQPKRTGIAKRPGQSDRDPMVLLCTAIINLPGEKPKAGAKPNPTPAGKASPPSSASKPASTPAASPASSELAEELATEIIGLFAAKETQSMKKMDITKGLFTSIDKGNGNRSKLMALAGKDDVLGALEGFTYDKGILSVAE